MRTRYREEPAEDSKSRRPGEADETRISLAHPAAMAAFLLPSAGCEHLSLLYPMHLCISHQIFSSFPLPWSPPRSHNTYPQQYNPLHYSSSTQNVHAFYQSICILYSFFTLSLLLLRSAHYLQGLSAPPYTVRFWHCLGFHNDQIKHNQWH